jgi:hypothetical protein
LSKFPALIISLQELKQEKRVGGVAQVEECLSSKCEASSSNPSTAKKDRETKESTELHYGTTSNSTYG